MERKSRPPDADWILFLQFFNTPGNEITPGSDIIGKYFKNGRVGHDQPPNVQKRGGSWGMNRPG
jgi:hypothetical protein